MTTPLRQQYLQIKKQFPGTMVFFRLGDFYESFDDDAKIVSSVSDMLTGRDMGTGNRVLLVGVPYHALDTYLAKIIHAGQKVAIVEQTGNQQKVEGVPGRVLETRDVARSASPQPGLSVCSASSWPTSLAVAAYLPYNTARNGSVRSTFDTQMDDYKSF